MFRPHLKSCCTTILFTLAAACSFALPQYARGAEAVTMQVGSPLSVTDKPLALQVRVGRWFPVAVTLANTGAAVQGRLELRLVASAGQDDRSSVFYADVDLPANQARKRVWLYGRADGDEFDEARITFSGRGFKSITAPMRLVRSELGTRVTLTISDSDERLAYLSSFKDKRLANTEELRMAQNTNTLTDGQSLLRPLGAPRDMVPDRWIGLESADLLVLADFAHSTLLPEQISTLRGFVAGGGTMLVFGGADWQRLSQSPLADLWPLSPSSSSPLGASQVRQIVGRYLENKRNLNGADRLGGAPVLATRGTLRPDVRIIASLSETPLLLAREVGAGRLLFLTANPSAPPFLGWSGLEPLWVELVQQLASPRRLEFVNRNAQSFGYGYGYNAAQNNDSTSQMLLAIRRLKQLQTPPTSVIAWFLALYVFCLVPVNYFVLRSFDRRELAWVTVPVIAVAFSVASYLAARQIKGTELLTRQINIVQSAGASDAARADAMLWLFSPRRASYVVSSDNPQMVSGDYIEPNNPSASNIERSSLLVRQPDAGQAFRVEDLGVNMWSEDKLIGQSVVNMGRGVSVTPTADGFRVSNNSPFDLRGAVLVTGGQVRAYGDIKGGATSTAGKADGSDLSDPQLMGRIEKSSGLDAIFGEPKSDKTAPAAVTADVSTMRQLAQTALQTALGAKFSRTNKQALLVAWGTSPAATLQIEGETPRAQSVTLFVFRLNDALIARNPRLR